MKFLDLAATRRSFYELDSNTDFTKEQATALLSKALDVTPSAFNMQSARLALLWEDKSKEFWDKVNATFDNSIDPGKFKGFSNAKGTVLFFVNKDTVAALEKQFPPYAHNFPIWAQHEGGMIQNNVWAALTSEGLGATLQHYNPVINDWVLKDYGLDESWDLVAQMPFGNPLSHPAEKEKLSDEERMKVF